MLIKIGQRKIYAHVSVYISFSKKQQTNKRREMNTLYLSGFCYCWLSELKFNADLEHVYAKLVTVRC